jgi:hypothetical protein
MKRSALLALSALALLACSTTPKRPPSSLPPAPSAPEAEPSETIEEDAPVLVALPIVRPGVYRLKLSARCAKVERSVTGLLTLDQIAAGSGESETGGKVSSERGRLLWGHTDVDLRSLSACLGGSARSAEEPIHPSVLVEVLKWEGEPRHQVLLVSFDAKIARGGRARAGGGVALRVETAEQGHMTGAWSRWELIGQDDGRWEAELEPDKAESGVNPAKAARTGSRSSSRD